MAQLFDRPVAHRGLHDRAGGVIENSATAFARAVAGDFAIECDLQLTRDGVPVVFHDETLERLTGLRGAVRDITADALCATPLLASANGDCPQRLADFLKQIAGRVRLQIELKRQRGPATGMLAKRVAEQLDHYAGPVTVQSFDPALIMLVRKFGFKGKRGIITGRYAAAGGDDAGLSGAQRFFLRHLLHWPLTRFSFISCDKTALDLPAVRRFKALGMPLTAWTVTSRDEAALARRAGAQIVFEGFDPDHD